MAETLLQYATQVPNKARRGVVEIFAAENALFELLKFQDLGDAFVYEYDREASLGGIGFRSLNGDYPAAAKTTGVVNQIREPAVILGGEANIDRQLYGNNAYKANKVAMKAKAAARFYIKNFVKGDTKTNPKGFDGLYKRLTGGNLKWGGTNGGPIDLLVLEELMDRVPGENSQKVLLMGAAMRRRLGAVIRADDGTIVTLIEWEGKHTPKSYNGSRIVVPGEDEAGTEIMQFNETRGSSNVTGSIVCFRPGENDEEFVVGIATHADQGIFEVEDQGVRGTTGQILVEGRAGLTVHHPKGATRYGGITNALPA